MAHGHFVIARDGVGGLAPDRALAIQGSQTLIVERDVTFEGGVHRVGMCSWRVAEAHILGLDDLLHDSGADNVCWWKRYLGPGSHERCEFVRSSSLNFHHPVMQRTLLDAGDGRRGDTPRNNSYWRRAREFVSRATALGIKRGFAER